MTAPAVLAAVLLLADDAADGGGVGWTTRAQLVRLSPDASSAVVGWLEAGAEVELDAPCAADSGWAALRPSGFIPAGALAADAGTAPPAEEYVWGVARGDVLPLRAAPALRARIVDEAAADRAFAFDDDSALLDAGWLRRGGRYVPTAAVWLSRPSAFHGVERPEGAVAFAYRATTVVTDKVSAPLPKGLAMHALSWTRTSVVTDDGTVPRNAVRLAVARPRPAQVPPEARWVHIDLNEQVLTAYEGDAWVYATLVSTGTADFPTTAGTFQVNHKALHERMHGEGYYVEEVPWIQYFHYSEALHGAFWHDAFGTRQSHGCVNLSLADARWLFEWSPPPLPTGWHGVAPLAGGFDSLWVVVERARPPGPPLTCSRGS